MVVSVSICMKYIIGKSVNENNETTNIEVFSSREFEAVKLGPRNEVSVKPQSN